MQRREFMTLVAGVAAAACPPLARAEQGRIPVVGFLATAVREGTYLDSTDAFIQGLADSGYEDGRNMRLEHRWADNQPGRLPELAADLVRRQVAVIFATGSVNSALIAKAATKTIPIVFANGSDPIKFGLVQSINRPGGNMTGVSFFNNMLGPKRLELLRELLPKAERVALLVNPNNPNTEFDTANMQAAAQKIGVTVFVVPATNDSQLDSAFLQIVAQRADALIVSNDVLFQSRLPQIVTLAARHTVPSMHASRQQTRAGALISYGTDTQEMYREAAHYVGRILKGEQPGNLPVLQPTKFELVVNLKTAKALGLTITESFLLRADEVIE